MASFSHTDYTALYMESKKVIYLSMVIGSLVGGYIPLLWDASLFSVSGVLFTALGGFLGIWLGNKISL